MFGTSVTLNHLVSQERHRDLIAEATRQRSVNIALDGRARTRRPGIAEIRTVIATVLLRAGSWLMPEEAPSGCGNPAHRAFELRPGQ